MKWTQLHYYKPPHIPYIANDLDSNNFETFVEKDNWLF